MSDKLVNAINEVAKAIAFLAIVVVIVSTGTCTSLGGDVNNVKNELNKIHTQLENMNRKMHPPEDKCVYQTGVKNKPPFMGSK